MTKLNVKRALQCHRFSIWKHYLCKNYENGPSQFFGPEILFFTAQIGELRTENNFICSINPVYNVCGLVYFSLKA